MRWRGSSTDFLTDMRRPSVERRSQAVDACRRHVDCSEETMRISSTYQTSWMLCRRKSRFATRVVRFHNSGVRHHPSHRCGLVDESLVVEAEREGFGRVVGQWEVEERVGHVELAHPVHWADEESGGADGVGEEWKCRGYFVDCAWVEDRAALLAPDDRKEGSEHEGRVGVNRSGNHAFLNQCVHLQRQTRAVRTVVLRSSLATWGVSFHGQERAARGEEVEEGRWSVCRHPSVGAGV